MFTTHKKEIFIDLWRCAEYIKNKKLLSIVLHDMAKTDGYEYIYRSEFDFTNLIKPQIFELFSNLTHITIETGGYPDHYIISLLGLLSIIKHTAIKKIVITASKGTGRWLRWLWSSDNRQYIVNRYGNDGFKLQKIESSGDTQVKITKK